MLALGLGIVLGLVFGALPLSQWSAKERQAALYQEITTLGAQAWMTGTGPELFEAIGDHAQRLIVTETGGFSQVASAN